jgi:hypothetical protein
VDRTDIIDLQQDKTESVNFVQQDTDVKNGWMRSDPDNCEEGK